MEAVHFVSPLETVQVLSIFSYVNTLSDFLFAENFLKQEDQHKHIPIVNGLYNYLQNNNNNQKIGIQEKKIHLARKLINGTDLYGGKEYEIPDHHFVDTLFNHIVDSLVFDRFANVYGFIAYVLRYTGSDSLIPLQHRLKKTLISLNFENEYGEDSQLEASAIDSIFNDIIEPLFPKPKNYPVNINSIDYIYALAGKMFIRTDKTEMGLNKILNRASTRTMDGNNFQEYVETAHAIEQLVLAKKVNESALKIFAFPALLNYVYKEKENIKIENIRDIISSPHHWKEAYKQLFSYLNDAFLSMETVQNNDYRYQFYLAMKSYKNRTTLAKEAIEMNCPPLTENEMKEEINKYKFQHKTYRCKSGNNNEHLFDLNRNYQELVDNVTEKYYFYERQISRAAFGEDFVQAMDNVNVVISKGLLRYFYLGSYDNAQEPVQLVKESDDLLQFYFPDNETYVFYALIRRGYNVSVIKEADNPTEFRETLGLLKDQTFRENYFPTVLKGKNEKFEKLLIRIAKERSKVFHNSLESRGYDETRKEWWMNFGLSLIPFYSCYKDIKEKNAKDTAIACTLDALFSIPVVGEMALVVGKTTEVAAKSLVALTETTLRTMTIRASIRTTLRITGRTLMDEMSSFLELLTKEMFRDLGMALVRFIDPGFELAFTIGKGGLRCIKTLAIQTERMYSIASASLKGMLERVENVVARFPRKIGKMFGKDTYVRSIVSDNSGYGYKFIPLKDGRVAEIRTVYPSKEEIPLVSQVSENNVMKYSKVDLETEQIIGDDFFVDMEGVVVSEEKVFEIHFEKTKGDGLVEGGNFISTVMKSFKSKKKVLTEAVEHVVKKGNLPEVSVRNEFKKYAFPETRNTEIDFAREWTSSQELKIPSWAEELRVEEPDLFFQLKYKEIMDIPELKFEDATKRIEGLYPLEKYPDIRKKLPIEEVLKDFKVKEVYKQANFEDYYALRWYGDDGYRKMAESSIEARRMKNAIYRLAIRQSEDPSEKYVTKLFRGEGRFPDAIEKEISADNSEFEFYRFTSTSTEINTAITYSLRSSPTTTRVTYVMKFEKPIVRARVEHLFVLDENETILLPGTKFHIENIERYTDVSESGIEQKCIRVEMTHKVVPKVEHQKSIMKEIKKLKETKSAFYHEDLLTSSAA